jgi:hypothetical protein
MSSAPSSSADRPKWLRFEASDEESHELFAPGANWRKQDQYPALKPLENHTRDDCLRLAWELHPDRLVRAHRAALAAPARPRRRSSRGGPP